MASVVEVNLSASQELPKDEPAPMPQLAISKPSEGSQQSAEKKPAEEGTAPFPAKKTEGGDGDNPKEVTPSSVNINSDKTEKCTESGDGKEKPAKADAPKPKIFDNKNFVEAPLPKVNPWTKNQPAVPVQPASLKIEAQPPKKNSPKPVAPAPAPQPAPVVAPPPAQTTITGEENEIF